MFGAAADVLCRIGEDGRVVREFLDLGAKAKVAATEAMDTEEALGEIPEEFLDPIQVRYSFHSVRFKVKVFCNYPVRYE